MGVVGCGCKAKGKAYGTESCSCHHGKISCTVYCACACSDDCFHPFKSVEENVDEVEDGRAADGVEEGYEEFEHRA